MILDAVGLRANEDRAESRRDGSGAIVFAYDQTMPRS
jgi:hypothetical protein